MPQSHVLALVKCSLQKIALSTNSLTMPNSALSTNSTMPGQRTRTLPGAQLLYPKAEASPWRPFSPALHPPPLLETPVSSCRGSGLGGTEDQHREEEGPIQKHATWMGKHQGNRAETKSKPLHTQAGSGPQSRGKQASSSRPLLVAPGPQGPHPSPFPLLLYSGRCWNPLPR